MNREVRLEPHNPEWEISFLEEADLLSKMLGLEVISIHHIGSTAIPAISAKPIVDILVEVQSIQRVDAFNQVLTEHGYIPKGEFGLDGRRFFIKGSEEIRTHYIHMYAQGHPDIARHLVFRDYLQHHAEAAAAYGKLKEALAAQFPSDTDAYQDGKSAWINEAEAQAAIWKTSQL